MSVANLNNGYDIETGIQSCDGCIFLSAAGCEMDRLEKLKTYDMKRYCNWYRDVKWFKQQPKKADYQMLVIDESEIAIDFIVYDDSDASTDTYIEIAENLNYKVVPKQVIFVVNGDGTKIPEIVCALRGLELTYPWNFKHIVETDKSFEDCVDMASKTCKSTFIAVCSVSYDMSENITLALDAVYNDLFKPIALVTEGTGNFYMVSRMAFEALGRNSGTYPDGSLSGNIIEKLTQQATQEGLSDRLFDLEDILNA